MRTRLFLLSLLALLVAAAPASATIVPNKGMAGVTLGQCQERVIEILGAPDRTFGSRDFAGFKSSYYYDKSALKLEFRAGPDECLVLICWLGSMTPSKPLTEFRIDSKGRVNNVRVAIVID